MQVRVLGARQGESNRSHFASLLVDGTLALDAGSIASTLTLEEQAEIQHVLLTHQHYDHIRDLASLGFNLMGRGQVGIYCTPGVRAAIGHTILSSEIWLDFFTMLSPENPTFTYTPVEHDQEFTLPGYRILPRPVIHALPAVAYEITSSSGGTLVYTGDCGPGSFAALASANPDLLLTEATLCNAETASAARFGHLSPQLLGKELKYFRSVRGFLPRVAVVHVNPYQEGQVAAEIAALARDLSADIWLPEEGAIITV